MTLLNSFSIKGIKSFITSDYCVGDDYNCTSGKADVVMALDVETDQTTFIFMREYAKKVIERVFLNQQTGVMMSLQTFGISVSELADFTASRSALTTALDNYRQLRPTQQRNISLIIDRIIDKFNNYNRPGVPRIAIVFVSGNTKGDYNQMKLKAQAAALQHNIVLMAITNNKEFTIRDLDALTSYVPGRIFSTNYKDTTMPSIAEVMPAVCKCKYLLCS